MSFTKLHLYFDDVQVNQEWTSLGRTITQADVVNFAGISGDFNPIHMDHDFAKTTPFRGPIAHGVLVFAVGSGLALYSPPMRTLAFLSSSSWIFKKPVFIGDTIHVQTKLIAKEERARGRRGIITWHRQIIKQDGTIVQEGQTQTLVEGRAGVGSPIENP